MKILGFAGIIVSAVGLVLSIADLVKLIREYERSKVENELVDEKMKGWLKGYLAGDKEFAKYVKEHNPELFRDIESY